MIPIQLKFRSMDDSSPAGSPSGAGTETAGYRNQLRDLMTKVDRSADLENILERVLQNETELKALSSQLGTDQPKE